jgi:flagellar hook protein FlgE
MAAIDTIITGMDADNRWMNVISNNLANLNTTGYKTRSVSFEDLLSQTLQGGTAPSAAAGGRQPLQIGLGTQVGAVTPDITQGALQQTGVSTDVAIQGSGYLVLQQGGSQVFSRDGGLVIDAAGNLVQASTGARVMGWLAEAGVVTPQGAVSPISFLDAQSVPPVATTTMSLVGNLEGGATSNQPLQTTVYDSLGNPLSLQYTFIPAGPNLWTWQATIPAAQGTIPGATGTYSAGSPWTGTPTIPSGSDLGASPTPYSIVLDSSGNADIMNGSTIVAIAPGAAGAAAGSTITFTNVDAPTQTAMVAKVGGTALPPAPGSGTTSLGTVTVTSGGTGTITFTSAGVESGQTGGPITITPADGAAALSITPSFSGATQYAAPTTIALGTQNGTPPGSLQSFSIGTSGVITGSYSNGQQQAIAQIALATFSNPQGLLAIGQNQWQQSPDSGTPSIGAAGSGAIGTLAGGALEQSNVDMSTELTNIIQAQSSFQADARVVTAITAMDQAVIQMVS